jgi:hypothetical protein
MDNLRCSYGRASSCAVWNSILTMEMTDKVNERLPHGKQFPLLFGQYRYFELRREYRLRFPEDNLLSRIDRLTVAMFALFVGAVISGHLFRS